MQYNFEGVAEELVVKFDKKLDAHRKVIMKHLGIAFTALGDHLPNEQHQQLEVVIGDIISDAQKSQSALFMQMMNKVVREIKNVLKG